MNIITGDGTCFPADVPILCVKTRRRVEHHKKKHFGTGNLSATKLLIYKLPSVLHSG